MNRERHYRDDMEDNPIKEFENIFTKIKKVYKNKINKKVENNYNVSLQKDIVEEIKESNNTLSKASFQTGLSATDIMALLKL